MSTDAKRTSYRDLLARVLPYALLGAGEDPDALYLMQQADAILSAQRERAIVRQKARYAANPEKFREKTKEYKTVHGDPTAGERKRRYRERHAYNLMRSREYAETRKSTGKEKAYRESRRDERRQYVRQRAADATLGYVKELMVKGTPLSPKDIPDEVAEVKRIELQIKRKLRTA